MLSISNISTPSYPSKINNQGTFQGKTNSHLKKLQNNEQAKKAIKFSLSAIGIALLTYLAKLFKLEKINHTELKNMQKEEVSSFTKKIPTKEDAKLCENIIRDLNKKPTDCWDESDIQLFESCRKILNDYDKNNGYYF